MDDTAMAGQPIDGVLDANDRAHGFHLSSESFLCACIQYLAIYFNVLCAILAGFMPRIKVLFFRKSAAIALSGYFAYLIIFLTIAFTS
jgi:hypothetical protein